MKWADNKKSITKIISDFFKLENVKSLEEIADSLSVGDNTLELFTLQLIRDKMELNRYFTLTPQSYHECREQCKSLLQ